MKHDIRDLTTEHSPNTIPDTEGTADSSDVSALFNNIMTIESERSTQCDNKVPKMEKQNSTSHDKTISETQKSSNSLSQLNAKQNTNNNLTNEKKNSKKIEKTRNSYDSNNNNNNNNNKMYLKSPTNTNHVSNQNLKTFHISSNSKNLKIVLLGTNLSPKSSVIFFLSHSVLLTILSTALKLKN
jgi:hypothetical protein